MNTGLQFFSKLSPTEQEQFKENFMSKKSKEIFNQYLRNKHSGLRTFIIRAFLWSNTPQGNSYWSGISLREL